MKNLVKTIECNMAEIISAYAFAHRGGGGNPLVAWVLGCFDAVNLCIDWFLAYFNIENGCTLCILACFDIEKFNMTEIVSGVCDVKIMEDIIYE